MLARSYKTSYRLSAEQMARETDMRTAWTLFYRMARINKWEASRIIADLAWERRTLLWWALDRSHQEDWLAIRAQLSTKFPSSPAAAFRNTHGY